MNTVTVTAKTVHLQHLNKDLFATLCSGRHIIEYCDDEDDYEKKVLKICSRYFLILSFIFRL